MDIYAKKGTRVILLIDRDKKVYNGWDYDKTYAEEHLDIDRVYTIDYTVVDSSSTEVYLQEVPDKPFNSVQFREVKV